MRDVAIAMMGGEMAKLQAHSHWLCLHTQALLLSLLESVYTMTDEKEILASEKAKCNNAATRIGELASFGRDGTFS